MPPDYGPDEQDADLLEQCVSLYRSGRRTAAQMARVILRMDTGDPEAQPAESQIEAIRACLQTSAFRRRLLWARQHGVRWIQEAGLHACPRALQTMVWLSSEANEDKRTRNSAAQFLLGSAAGFSPTQRHELSGSEEFMHLFQAIYPSLAKPPSGLTESAPGETQDSPDAL